MDLRIYDGETIQISPEDYQKVSGFTWRVLSQESGRPYVAATGVRNDAGSRTTLSLGRLILDAPRGKVVIHRNGDDLDFRRENLELIGRDVLRAMAPVGIEPSSMSSRYRGVSKDRKGRYVATCGKVRVGVYDDEKEAARAYDTAATERYGARAQRNFTNAP